MGRWATEPRRRPCPGEADGGGNGETPDTPRPGMREPHRHRRPAGPRPTGTAAGGTGSTACRREPLTARRSGPAARSPTRTPPRRRRARWRTGRTARPPSPALTRRPKSKRRGAPASSRFDAPSRAEAVGAVIARPMGGPAAPSKRRCFAVSGASAVDAGTHRQGEGDRGQRWLRRRNRGPRRSCRGGGCVARRGLTGNPAPCIDSGPRLTTPDWEIFLAAPALPRRSRQAGDPMNRGMTPHPTGRGQPATSLASSTGQAVPA